MMVDMSSFSDERFDPKKWINDACQSRHPQDPLDKHLVDLEMKLQMASEEISASLEELSASALHRVPRATRDVIRLRDDAISLRSSVASILQKLRKAEGSSAESISTLAKVDTVKRRMEAAYETLQDAAGLTQLSSTVEDVFSSGDLPRAAETLANMKHCLSAVGEVAEFANIRKQLEVLEDRLESMVQPRLTDALTNRKVDVAQEMRGILNRIGRFKSLELQYSKVHLKPIKQLWEDFELRQESNKVSNEKNETERPQLNSSSTFSRWLPNFYDELLLYLEQEWKWCTLAFPEEYKTLVPNLLIETMSIISSSFISSLNSAVGEAVPETRTLTKGIIDITTGELPKGVKLQTKHLDALIELHNTTTSFARNIQLLFSDKNLDTLKAIYTPFEPFKIRYGQMERAVLSGEILRGASITLAGVQGVELSETVRRMEESIPHVIQLLEASVERCIAFTAGAEIDELILALDDVMLQYISILQENLKSLRAVKPADDEEWSVVQSALQILTVADSLTGRSSVFEASLKSTLARLRLPDLVHPEKARKLLNLLDQSKDPRFHALPVSSQRVSTFSESVNELVYDVLVSKPRALLTNVSGLGVWSDEAETVRPLPTFSAYPQAYVTNVGEYLLTLPQQLEPLADGISDSEDAQYFATEWMFKVAEGVTGLYVDQLRGIMYVTDRGAQQLCVDIEYLSNVLSALSMPVPTVLATFQSCLSVPRDEVKELVKEPGNQLDLPTAQLVCRMRRVGLD